MKIKEISNKKGDMSELKMLFFYRKNKVNKKVKRMKVAIKMSELSEDSAYLI